MIRKIVRAVALVALSSAAVAEAQTTTAIVGARVIDGTGAPARLETVILQGNRILAVSPKAEIPQGAAYLTQPDRPLCQGSSICTHLNASGTDAVDDLGKSLKAYLVSRVISVNDCSVYGEMLAPLRALEGGGALVGPQVKFAILFGTPEGHGAEFGWGDYFTQLVSTPALLPRMAPLDITLCCF
jgi:hypothetical protein